MAGYTSLFNNFTVFALLYDEDVNDKIALKYPPLYKTLQSGKTLSIKTFLAAFWLAMF